MSEYNDGTGNWHSETMALYARKDSDSLIHILRDCHDAIHALPDNPKCAQYMDEMHYAGMELKKRGYQFITRDKCLAETKLLQTVYFANSDNKKTLEKHWQRLRADYPAIEPKPPSMAPHSSMMKA